MFTLEKDKYGVSTMASVHGDKTSIRGDAILEKEYLSAQLGGIPKISEQLFLDLDKDFE